MPYLTKEEVPCLGYWTHTTDGSEFDCEYPYAGQVTCDDCIINGRDKDPRTGKRFARRKEKRTTMNNKFYWYQYYVGECPVCGKDCSYKKRVYSDKPRNLQDRIVLIPLEECYDWCDI